MSFSVGGFSHGVVMLLTVVTAALMIWHRRSHPEGRTLDRWFAVFLSLAWPGSIWQYWHFGTLTLHNGLPLHLCDIALFTSIYALLTGSRTAVELTWYFGLAGTSHGLLTPALREEWPHPRFVTFFAQHAGVVVAALYLVLGHKQWPRPGSVRRAWLVSVGYCFVVGGINVLLRTNYGFLCAKPPTASLMDHFGPWPWYNGVVLLLAGVLFILLINQSDGCGLEKRGCINGRLRVIVRFLIVSRAAQHILITGANGLLGRAIAACFLTKVPDCRVYLGVRSNRDAAQRVVDDSGGRAQLVDLEVTSPESWSRVVEQIPQLDTLVNNAGFHDDALLATMTPEQWSGVIAANLNSVFLGCQSVIKTMATNRFGRIINVASLSAIHPPAGQTNYAAAKAGVLALTQSLGKEVARLGITVNAVCPAHIEGALPAGWTEEQITAAKRAAPMRRFARPEEIASLIFFLASAEASYITGAAIKIDGGLSLRPPAPKTEDMPDAALIQRIKEVIATELMLEVPVEEIGEDTPLFGPSGLGLDSVDALQLVIAIEKHFKLKIGDNAEARSVLHSVHTIAVAIESRPA